MKRAFRIQPQPDDASCGPTCLHALYRYYGENISLARVIREVKSLDDGGTLAVYLACHALRRGYSAVIYTYNVQMFDPSWFAGSGCDLAQKLSLQAQARQSKRLRQATEAYMEYLRLGGKVLFRNLTPRFLRLFLKGRVPVLTGLSATYLYACARERDAGLKKTVFDDIRGTPSGHFVVLTGYDRRNKLVRVADPYKENPFFRKSYYSVAATRLINAIMLGIVTYDANLLVIEPRRNLKLET
jgi:hypothetical protein